MSIVSTWILVVSGVATSFASLEGDDQLVLPIES